MRAKILSLMPRGWVWAAGLWMVTLTAPPSWSTEPFQVVSIQRTGNEITLDWIGGRGPFQVQAGDGAGEWDDLGPVVNGRSASVSWEGDAGYFRVLSSALGELFGRFDVMQGEFGDPMARHRLKSIWEFYKPRGGAPANPPGAFYESLSVRMESWEASGPQEFQGKLDELPGAQVTIDDRFLRVTWRTGELEDRRDFTLTLEFGYSLEDARFQPLHLSDAYANLECLYARPQWTLDFEGKPGTTTKDETQLVEMVTDEEPGSFFPWERQVEVRSGAVTARSIFDIGRFYDQGEPAFILKTPVLLDWREGTTVTGLTAEPLVFTGHYSQTYDPSHHNFVETLWLDPEREPGMAVEVLEELRQKDIWLLRATQPSAFPEDPVRLQAAGFDGSLRDL
ncbi:MAG TPA: hypothetical protein VMN36_02225 [Verrucomicrobiales bacterium]|nr:hypothetical protein [Verrucomicrobiales bacterium]